MAPTYFGPSFTTTAVLGRTQLSPQEIVSRLTGTLYQVAGKLNIRQWICPAVGVWDGSEAQLHHTLSQYPAMADQQQLGAPFGQSVSLHADFQLISHGPTGPIADEYGIHIGVLAGGPTLGHAHPLQRVRIKIHPRHQQLNSMSLPQTLLALSHTLIDTLVQTWEPIMVHTLSRGTELRPAEGGWDIPCGLQLWLPSAIVPIQQTSDGVYIQPMGAGVLLTNPVDVPEAELGRGLRATLELNGYRHFPPPAA